MKDFSHVVNTVLQVTLLLNIIATRASPICQSLMGLKGGIS